MKTIPAALLTHYAKTVTTICHCWLVVLQDGTKYGFTDNVEDIFIIEDGVLYKAETGFTATAIRNTNILDVDNLDVEGAVSDESISIEDLNSGRWKNAYILIFKLNYNSPNAGKEYLIEGTIGDIKYSKGLFNVEIRSIAQKLQRPIGELYSQTCRARLGDERCKLDLSPFTFDGVVEAIYQANDRLYASSINQDENYFRYGFLTFVTGENAGKTYEVKSNLNGVIFFQLPILKKIALGDTFTVLAGCDGTLTSCRDKFNNIKNMRAEPYIPTNDEVLSGAEINV